MRKPIRPAVLGGPRPAAVRLRSLLLLGACVLSAACGAEAPPPALAVGSVAFRELELGVLSHRDRQRLGDLAAFGLTVANDETGRLLRPFAERERQTLLLQKLATEIAAGSDEGALRRAYLADPEYELEVRHLVILSERWRSDEERARARATAERALRQARSGVDFAAVAADFSEEPGAVERGGLLRPGREGTWVPEFWEAASALRPGEISDIVETEYGFHVLKLEERRPIPFEEVRGRVVGRLVDLAAAAGKAEAWAEEQARMLRLEREAIADWRRRRSPDATVLAAWPDGEYTAAELRRYLLTLDTGSAERLAGATDSVFIGVVAAAARNALLTSRGAALGVELSAAESASAEQRWLRKIEGWAAALGFREGANPAEVKKTALAALTDRRQSVQIARGEVLAIAPALRALYPVVVRQPVPTGTAQD